MRLLSPLRFFAVLFCLPLLQACSGPAIRLDISDQPAMAGMLTDLSRSRVIFAGEFHDQRDHHLLQLEIIKDLYRKGLRPAIGLEMFDIEKQPVLDEWTRGNMGLQEFVARYQQGWRINWAEYDAIFLFARNNRIPLVALDAPQDIVRAITRAGAAVDGRSYLKRLPAGVTTEISPSYRSFMASAFLTHQLPDAMFDNFCAAQGLRNSTMVKRITGYLHENPDRIMVVVAGVGHAMRRGVPSGLPREGFPYRIVIPRVEGLYENLAGDDMDYFVTTGN